MTLGTSRDRKLVTWAFRDQAKFVGFPGEVQVLPVLGTRGPGERLGSEHLVVSRDSAKRVTGLEEAKPGLSATERSELTITQVREAKWGAPQRAGLGSRHGEPEVQVGPLWP